MSQRPSQQHSDAQSQYPELPWSLDDRPHRVVIRIETSDNIPFTPCAVELDVRQLGESVGAESAADPASFAMVGYSDQGIPLVYDPDSEGDFRLRVPCRYDDGPNGGGIAWVARNQEVDYVALYFDVATGVQWPAERCALIGDGDVLRRQRGPISHTYAVRVAVVDWNGDGRWDLITGGWRGDLWYWENIGTNKSPLYAAPVTLRDVNGQVLIVGEGLFLTHQGEGEGWHVETAPVRGWNRISPCIVDWTEEGHPDLLIGHVDGSIYHLHNEGRNTQSPDRTFSVVGKLEADGVPIGEDPYVAPSVADWDGDGAKDLLVGTYHGRVRWYRNVGSNAAPVFTDGGYLMANGAEIRVNVCAVPTAVDWFGTDTLDLIVGDHEGNVFVFRNIGEGSGVPELSIGLPLEANGRTPILGQYAYAGPVALDWDGDGLPELVVAAFEGVHLFDNVGEAGRPLLTRLDALEALQVPLSPQSSQPLPAVCDLEDRGVNDIFTGTAYGHIIWFRNRGTNLWPEFDAGVKLSAGNEVLHFGGGSDGYLRGYPHPYFVDWDGDGDLDLVVATELGYVYLVENIGTKSEPLFAPPVHILSEGAPIKVTDRASVLVVDWHNKGGRDLLVGHSRTYARADIEPGLGRDYGVPHGVVLFRDTGPGCEVGPGEVVMADGSPLSFDDRLSLGAFTDWNGNGRRDLLINEDEKNILLYPNIGDDTNPAFGPPRRLFPGEFSPQTSLYYSTVADWNGDGWEELIVGSGMENGHLYLYSKGYFHEPPKVHIDSVETATQGGQLR